MYKVSNKSLPTSFDDYFNSINHDHDTKTKQNIKYKLPRPRTDLGKRSIKYFGIKSWSDLDSDIKLSCNYRIFKNKLKETFFKG